MFLVPYNVLEHRKGKLELCPLSRSVTQWLMLHVQYAVYVH